MSLVYSLEICFIDTHSQAARMRKEKERRARSWVGEDTAAAPAPKPKKYEILLKEKEENMKRKKYLTNSWHNREKSHRYQVYLAPQTTRRHHHCCCCSLSLSLLLLLGNLLYLHLLRSNQLGRGWRAT